MSLTVIHDRNKVEYHALSTDVSSGSIPGATWIGAKVILTDTGQEYFVATDFELLPYGGGGALGYTTATETVITAGSVSGSLVAENTSRKYLFIQNQSGTESVYLSTSTSATTSNVSLSAGSNKELYGYSLYRGALKVITSGSTTATLAIVEGT